jgi:hypothetical protein
VKCPILLHEVTTKPAWDFHCLIEVCQINSKEIQYRRMQIYEHANEFEGKVL